MDFDNLLNSKPVRDVDAQQVGRAAMKAIREELLKIASEDPSAGPLPSIAVKDYLGIVASINANLAANLYEMIADLCEEAGDTAVECAMALTNAEMSVVEAVSSGMAIGKQSFVQCMLNGRKGKSE